MARSNAWMRAPICMTFEASNEYRQEFELGRPDLHQREPGETGRTDMAGFCGGGSGGTFLVVHRGAPAAVRKWLSRPGAGLGLDWDVVRAAGGRAELPQTHGLPRSGEDVRLVDRPYLHWHRSGVRHLL